MNYRFVVLDRGLESNVYKIPVHQTARLENEGALDDVRVYENLPEAKEAALMILSRYGEAAKKSVRRFSVRTDPRIESMKAQISELTEEGVATYFL